MGLTIVLSTLTADKKILENTEKQEKQKPKSIMDMRRTP